MRHGALRVIILALTAAGTLAAVSAAGAAAVTPAACQKPEPWRNLVLISTKNGAVNRGFPDVDGSVNTVLADGSGGWFVGGGFTCVGTVAAAGLVHLEADGSLDTSWHAALPVDRRSVAGIFAPYALALSAGKLLVGSGFGVEALDAATGARDWLVRARSKGVRFPRGVGALAARGNRVYAGGDFDTIRGVPRRALAALDVRSGRVLAWRPHFATAALTKAGQRPSVEALAVSGHRLYVGGYGLAFAGNQHLEGLVALSVDTGRVFAWTPRKQTYTGYLATGDVETILVTHGEVITAGRDGWAVTSARTGRSVPWSQQIGARYFAAFGDLVYLGGDCRSSFTAAAGKPRNNLAAIDLATQRFTDWAPIVNKYNCIQAMAASPVQVLAAGGFSQTLG